MDSIDKLGKLLGGSLRPPLNDNDVAGGRAPEQKDFNCILMEVSDQNMALQILWVISINVESLQGNPHWSFPYM